MDNVTIFVKNEFYETDKESAEFAVKYDGAIIVNEDDRGAFEKIREEEIEKQQSRAIAKERSEDIQLQEQINKFYSNVGNYMRVLDKLLKEDIPEEEIPEDDKPEDGEDTGGDPKTTSSPKKKKTSKKKTRSKKE